MLWGSDLRFWLFIPQYTFCCSLMAFSCHLMGDVSVNCTLDSSILYYKVFKSFAGHLLSTTKGKNAHIPPFLSILKFLPKLTPPGLIYCFQSSLIKSLIQQIELITD